MGDLLDRDQEHLRLLAIGFYIEAGTAAFFSLFSLLYVFLGALMSSGMLPQENANVDPRMMGAIFLFMGIAVLVLGLGFAGLTWLAGRSLKHRRRRVLCLVLAALGCLQIPWGTAFGVCCFMVLNRPSVKALFDPHALPAPPPPQPPYPFLPPTA